MPAHTVANPLPYKWRELLGKLRVTRRLSPLTDAFEEGQPVTFGQQPCGSEALGLQSADGASAGLILRIDEWGGWGSQQGTQTTTCGPLDHDHPAAGRERTVDLLKHADASFRAHPRQQPFLVVDHDQVERPGVKRKPVQAARLELQEESEFFSGAHRPGGLGL